jgi:hypothetical protein
MNMSLPPNPSWRSVFRQHLTSARLSVLDQILSTVSGLTIDASSKILISNTDAAERLLNWYTEFNNEATLPSIVIAQELTETTVIDPCNAILQSAARILPLEHLSGHKFTHTILHIHTDRSQDSILQLLTEMHRLLATGGQLILSRRKQDRLAEILHTAGVHVPGGKGDLPKADPLDERLAMLVAEAGFAQSGISKRQESYIVSSEGLEQLFGILKTALSAELGVCAEGSGWKARFDDTIDREATGRDGTLLVADVLIATK